ncbi:MAG: polysaccharide deacetylase family protein [Myxococcales bacterium]|nr:polysaccharide deacetylase family protein [Myxococcales bacterium]
MSSMPHRCSISIDVDPIPCYYKIHSLGKPPADLRSRVLCTALPRFAAILAARDIKATFFIVAEDVDVRALGNDAIAMRAALREIRELGHEIANHSYSHPYELARLGREETREQLGKAHDLLSDFTGSVVRGFRAPGYDISPTTLEELIARDYLYDSSVFPAPGYYLAKALVMGVLRVMGRKSGAVMTNVRALSAPIRPYHPSAEAPWRRGASSLVELPVAVTSLSRTPVIGTNLLLAPTWLRDHWLRSMSKREFFNLEMHGIDLCDAEDDGIPSALVARQPDLRVPAAVKMASLSTILDQLLASGTQMCTLREFASTVA